MKVETQLQCILEEFINLVQKNYRTLQRTARAELEIRNHPLCHWQLLQLLSSELVLEEMASLSHSSSQSCSLEEKPATQILPRKHAIFYEATNNINITYRIYEAHTTIFPYGLYMSYLQSHMARTYETHWALLSYGLPMFYICHCCWGMVLGLKHLCSNHNLNSTTGQTMLLWVPGLNTKFLIQCICAHIKAVAVKYRPVSSQKSVWKV